MKKMAAFRLLLACFLSILLSASVVPAHAAEREVYHSSFQGQSVYADVDAYDGCTITMLYIEAVDGRTKTEGRPIQSSTASGWISQYNYCDGGSLYGYFGTQLDDGALQIDRQLQTATLNTTVQVCHYGCFPATLQLIWTGTGDIYRDKGRYQNTSPYYKSMSRYDGESRQSRVSGSVTTPLATGHVEGGSGAMRSLKSGFLSIYKLS